MQARQRIRSRHASDLEAQARQTIGATETPEVRLPHAGDALWLQLEVADLRAGDAKKAVMPEWANRTTQVAFVAQVTEGEHAGVPHITDAADPPTSMVGNGVALLTAVGPGVRSAALLFQQGAGRVGLPAGGSDTAVAVGFVYVFVIVVVVSLGVLCLWHSGQLGSAPGAWEREKIQAKAVLHPKSAPLSSVSVKARPMQRTVGELSHQQSMAMLPQSQLSFAMTGHSFLSAGAPLCSDLVVPDGYQTVLSIPCLSLLALGEKRIQLQIFSQGMQPMLGLCAEVAWDRGCRTERWELFEWANRRSLASCIVAAGNAQLLSNGEARATVGRIASGASRQSGALGSARPGTPLQSSLLSARREASQAGTAAHIVSAERTRDTLLQVQGYSTSHEGGLVVTNADCTLAALTEPGQQHQGLRHCWLKAGPGVDAGLALMSMLAVDRLSQARG